MTEELQEKIAKLEAELTKLKEEAAKPKIKYAQTYIPEEGDIFFWLAGHGVVHDRVWYESNSPRYNEALAEAGNCYRTREEALREFERRLIIRELAILAGDFVPDWTDFEQKKYHIRGCVQNVITQGSSLIENRAPIQVFFRTEKDLAYAIRAVGEERLIRAFFNPTYTKEGENDA